MRLEVLLALDARGVSATASGGSFLGEDLLGGVDDALTSEVVDDNVDNVHLDLNTFPAALLLPPLASGEPPGGGLSAWWHIRDGLGEEVKY